MIKIAAGSLTFSWTITRIDKIVKHAFSVQLYITLGPENVDSEIKMHAKNHAQVTPFASLFLDLE